MVHACMQPAAAAGGAADLKSRVGSFTGTTSEEGTWVCSAAGEVMKPVKAEAPDCANQRADLKLPPPPAAAACCRRREATTNLAA